jgi:hypothetical protein
MKSKTKRYKAGQNTRKNQSAVAAESAARQAFLIKDAARKKADRLRDKLKAEQQAPEPELDQDRGPLSEKQKTAIANRCRDFFFQEADHLSHVEQGAVLRAQIDGPAFKQVREAAGILSRKETLVQKSFVKNTAEVLKSFGGKRTLAKDKFAAKHAIVTAVVSEETATNKLVSATAGALGIRRYLAKKARRRRLSALVEDGLWALIERSRRKNAISPELQEQVVRFWTDWTRVLPNQQDVRRHRLGRNQYENHPIHLLEKSQVSS